MITAALDTTEEIFRPCPKCSRLWVPRRNRVAAITAVAVAGPEQIERALNGVSQRFWPAMEAILPLTAAVLVTTDTAAIEQGGWGEAQRTIAIQWLLVCLFVWLTASLALVTEQHGRGRLIATAANNGDGRPGSFLLLFLSPSC